LTPEQTCSERLATREEQHEVLRVIFIGTETGENMARSHLHHDTLAPAFLPGAPQRYLVVRQEDIWFIKFDGEEYGPYKTEQEAMLFAIDAANKLGEQGEKTQVLQMDQNGEAQLVWRYGHDPYPPKQ
jgi:hypothetical protein